METELLKVKTGSRRAMN